MRVRVWLCSACGCDWACVWLHVWLCVFVWLCGCVTVWLCGCAAVRLCGCAVVRLCGCAVPVAVTVHVCGCMCGCVRVSVWSDTTVVTLLRGAGLISDLKHFFRTAVAPKLGDHVRIEWLDRR